MWYHGGVIGFSITDLLDANICMIWLERHLHLAVHRSLSLATQRLATTGCRLAGVGKVDIWILVGEL